MTDDDLSQRYLAAYDAQLRATAETPSAIAQTRLGPLRLVTFAGGRGFVTYPRLTDDDLPAGVRIDDWIEQALEHYGADPDVTRVEWKTRGHDRLTGLHEALVAHGFEPEEPESIMVGEAAKLAVDVELPAGVRLRRLTDETEVRAMCAMQDEAFGEPASIEIADAVVARLARDDGMQLWVAEADGEIVCAGRLEPVPDSDFAGIWGGATKPEWRRRGIYRALTAERARAALAMGKTLINSDSTEYSRPILQRSGLLKVSTTTPYRWTR